MVSHSSPILCPILLLRPTSMESKIARMHDSMGIARHAECKPECAWRVGDRCALAVIAESLSKRI
jgi:hypothetical protein